VQEVNPFSIQQIFLSESKDNIVAAWGKLDKLA